MKILFAFIIFISSNAILSQDSSDVIYENGKKNNSCQFRKEYFKSKLEASQSLDKFIDELIDKKCSTLLIGENHAFEYGNSLVVDKLLKAFSQDKTSKTCLFREASHKRNFIHKEIEKAVKRDSSITPQKLYLKLKMIVTHPYVLIFDENTEKAVLKRKPENFRALVGNEKFVDRTNRSFNLKILIKLAKSGIYLRTIDTTDDQGETGDNWEHFKAINRDDFMTNKILELENELSCDRTIFWGGSMHVNPIAKRLKEVQSFKEILKIDIANYNKTLTNIIDLHKQFQKGVITYLELRSRFKDGEDDSCNLEFKNITSPIVFESKGDSRSPRMNSKLTLMKYNWDLRFNDYDYHISVPVLDNNILHPQYQKVAKEGEKDPIKQRSSTLFWRPWLNKAKTLFYRVEELK